MFLRRFFKLLHRKNIEKTLKMIIYDYNKLYQDTSKVLHSFANTLQGIEFDEEKEPEELYNLTTLLLLSQTTASISLLLRQNHLVSVASLLRIIFESFFSINWITEADNVVEKNERVYRLEGNPLFNYEKELTLMEQDLKSPHPHWKPEVIKDFRKAIEYEKKRYPYLLQDNENFKNAPSVADRVGAKYRVKYYHLYRFTSFFSHPSPKLKEFFLSRSSNEEDSELKAVEPIIRTMYECLGFIVGILGYDVQLFLKYKNNENRSILFTEMGLIANQELKIYEQ